jgi:hypothetical protein
MMQRTEVRMGVKLSVPEKIPGKDPGKDPSCADHNIGWRTRPGLEGACRF